MRPQDFGVVTYIKVGNGFWVKPTYAAPVTPINLDGTWQTNITTGILDSTASRIVSYLVPRSYSPFLASGQSSLPPELNSFPSISASR